MGPFLLNKLYLTEMASRTDFVGGTIFVKTVLHYCNLVLFWNNLYECDVFISLSSLTIYITEE